METINIKAKKEKVVGVDVWEAVSTDGKFSARAYSRDESVEMVTLKILYAEVGNPKINVNGKKFNFRSN